MWRYCQVAVKLKHKLFSVVFSQNLSVHRSIFRCFNHCSRTFGKACTASRRSWIA
nr:MAG TPA: hypothetical protein [Caudoviricetes sp.]DAT68295.1 MAG TPA: hypothetical protein [Caudoviricetes sp.]